MPSPVLHIRINGEVHSYTPSQHTNAAGLWWAMQEEGKGIARPTSHGVKTHDMTAFIRDAIPLPRKGKH
jgi:hypothetical protein